MTIYQIDQQIVAAMKLQAEGANGAQELIDILFEKRAALVGAK